MYALETKGFLISVRIPIKNVQVKKLLDIVLIPRGMDIVKVETPAKGDIMETKEIL